MLDSEIRRLLGGFIRAHRERPRPQMTAGRRRTPGLRREEVAARAGISPTWLTFIEQGRAVRASPETLARLADALDLSGAERAYLFELAGRLDPKPVSHAQATPFAAIEAAVSAVSVPAYGLDRLWNACAWNAAAERLFTGWLDREGPHNLLRFVFLENVARSLIPDWEERGRRLLAEFRADFAHGLHDQDIRHFVDRMRADSDAFARAWNDQDVRHRAGGLRSFRHPADGDLHFVQHTFTPSDQRDFKLVILVPRTDASFGAGPSR